MAPNAVSSILDWYQMQLIGTLFTTISIAVMLAASAQAETILPHEASAYLGTEATVEGLVSQVSNSSRGTTFINFGGEYPNHVFYAVIFRDQAHLFPGVHSLEGRVVAIHGTIELYKGKPQIIVTTPEQIEER